MDTSRIIFSSNGDRHLCVVKAKAHTREYCLKHARAVRNACDSRCYRVYGKVICDIIFSGILRKIAVVHIKGIIGITRICDSNAVNIAIRSPGRHGDQVTDIAHITGNILANNVKLDIIGIKVMLIDRDYCRLRFVKIVSVSSFAIFQRCNLGCILISNIYLRLNRIDRNHVGLIRRHFIVGTILILDGNNIMTVTGNRITSNMRICVYISPGRSNSISCRPIFRDFDNHIFCEEVCLCYLKSDLGLPALIVSVVKRGSNLITCLAVLHSHSRSNCIYNNDFAVVSNFLARIIVLICCQC